MREAWHDFTQKGVGEEGPTSFKPVVLSGIDRQSIPAPSLRKEAAYHDIP